MKRIPALLALALLAAGFVEAARLALYKYFSIDEFQHAHISWLTGRGSVPYRDFFDLHFPFLYQVLGGLWLGMGDDPRNVRVLRLAMLGLLVVLALAAFVVNRREGIVAALAGPAILLTIAPFTVRATEIRPDPLAFTCFLSGLAVLFVDRFGPRGRGAAAGVLFTLAIWSSQKALLYGVPVGALLAVDAARRSRRVTSALESVADRIRSRRRGLGATLAAAAALLTAAALARLTVLRHGDMVALAFLFAGLAVFSLDRRPALLRGAAAGVLLLLAAWASRRALLLGLPAGAFFAAGTARVRRGDPSAFGSAPAAWAGGGSVAALVALYLTATRSWNGFLTFCLGWAWRQQTEYPALSSSEALVRALEGHAVVCLLAAAGVGASVAAWKRREAPVSDRDVLLVACLASSLAYVLDLKAPYEYNLIPFLGLVAVFAGRGVGALSTAAAAAATRRGAPARAPLVSALVVALALAAPAFALRRLERVVKNTNAVQIDVLERIAELTAPDDAVYDNSGSAVARPSASFFFYTDWLMRHRLGDMLARRVPEEVLKSGAVLFLRDARTGDLPESLQRFLRDYFKPYNGDLWLRGQRYRTDVAGRVASTFRAARKDRYFVEPASLLEGGTLTIDGRRVAGAVFELEPGEHGVTFEGAPSTDLHILWLPRDGRTWAPAYGAAPRFSRVL